MAEQKSEYKVIRLEEAIADTQGAELDEPWRERVTLGLAIGRFGVAGVLATGVLILFSLTICCTGTSITMLITAGVISGQAAFDTADAVECMMKFLTTLLPYVATPLGLVLGFFFRARNSE